MRKVIEKNPTKAFYIQSLLAVAALSINNIPNAGAQDIATNPELLAPETIIFLDTDGDGIADVRDNCVLVANRDQRDADNDGYGSMCDADLNNDHIVNALDLGLFRQAYGTDDAVADFNGDRRVDDYDMDILRSLYFKPPGPSQPDSDGDGIPNKSDNCVIVPNADQRDTDNDGYGSLCDPDLNNDRIVNAADLALFRQAIGTSDVNADFNGDGRLDDADLDIMRAYYFGAPGPSRPDTDGDNIPDKSDNCTLVANSDQRDTDNDGFGSLCDPDLNNDFIVNAADLAMFRRVFGTDDKNADFNGDGRVDFSDYEILVDLFFQRPGPSGIAQAPWHTQ